MSPCFYSRKRKLLFFIFCCCSLAAFSPCPVYADTDTEIYFHFQDEISRDEISRNEISLKEALSRLEAQYQVKFAYDEALVENRFLSASDFRKIIHAKGAFLKKLRQYLLPLNLEISRLGDYLVIMPKKQNTGSRPVGPLQQQTQSLKEESQQSEEAESMRVVSNKHLEDSSRLKVISGKVREENTAMPLPGINVLVKGTSRGTVTDAAGKYQLEVGKEAGILVFSSVGYTTREVEIGKQTTIDVAMATGLHSLSEVVVVGYGTQRTEEVTGAVVTVDMQTIEDLPLSGLDQQLAGQVAGVQISTSNGIPGGGPQVQIRGVGAVGAGSQPLYVIDGFPLSSTSTERFNPMNDIPPEDIASVSILKDASATAIYGSRGANGVIMITTRQGKKGESRIQLGVYGGLQAVSERYRPDLMNAREFAQYRKEAISDRIRFEEGREPTETDLPEIYRNPGQLGVGTNWFDEITRIAPIQHISLSVSRGSDKLASYFSAGYFRQEGVVLATGYQRLNFRANITAELSDRLQLGINLAPSYSLRKRSVSGGLGRGEEGFGEALVASPIPPVYNSDGSYNVMISSPGTFEYPNPVMVLNEVDDDRNRVRTLINTFADYEIAEHLTFKSTFNVDWQHEDETYFHPSTVGYTFQPPPTIPSARYVSNTFFNWLNENTLSYQGDFGDGHSLSTLLGYTVQKQTLKSSEFVGDDFPDDEVKTLNAAGRISGNTFEEEWALLSFLARLNYSFRNKYLLTTTVRRDGSSRFGNNNRWGTFPSVALGWRLSDEPFLSNAAWLSELKMRVSYGLSGNFDIGNYTYFGQLISNDYVFNESLAGGRIMSTLGNPELGWEKTREIDIGMDVGLLNNRVFLSADYYKRNTKDLLLNVEIPSSSGYAQVTENRGEIQNEGLELSLASRNLKHATLSWSSNFNIAFNKNKVLALGRAGAPILSGETGEKSPTHITMVGKPLAMFYGYVFDGIYQSEEEVKAGPSFAGAIPGNLRFKDMDGDGMITPIKDFDIIGNPYPDYIFGFTNHLSYRNFDLKIIMTGAVGGSRIRAYNEYFNNIDGVFNVKREVADRWRSPEAPGSGFIPTTNGSGRARVMFRDVSSLWVEDNSNLNVKNISLGYTLPEDVAEGILQHARIYLSVQNALLITKYKGNPEVTNYGEKGGSGTLVPGLDYSPYPVPRTFILGAKLSF
ncbi:TonB-linked SusC/RagA family outer membrane protein [Catalinimonas alkaloidigena]|uniref:SusC/RagA family TonB-linked outer membrane protein n=1 Tax=Catalinimonas alkaloidigena TaxID=1075417 RepID=UPI002405BB72|nr:TonB-dependent receptor [Catalinimonas alkaloidigena]MDF9799485.1 TonB-linked SusC/RagA family outer membrane protein [Catalinimonas alkaloidigena]